MLDHRTKRDLKFGRCAVEVREEAHVDACDGIRERGRSGGARQRGDHPRAHAVIARERGVGAMPSFAGAGVERLLARLRGAGELARRREGPGRSVYDRSNKDRSARSTSSAEDANRGWLTAREHWAREHPIRRRDDAQCSRAGPGPANASVDSHGSQRQLRGVSPRRSPWPSLDRRGSRSPATARDGCNRRVPLLVAAHVRRVARALLAPHATAAGAREPDEANESPPMA